MKFRWPTVLFTSILWRPTVLLSLLPGNIMSNTTTLDNWRFFGITFSYCIQELLAVCFPSLLLEPSFDCLCLQCWEEIFVLFQQSGCRPHLSMKCFHSSLVNGYLKWNCYLKPILRIVVHDGMYWGLLSCTIELWISCHSYKQFVGVSPYICLICLHAFLYLTMPWIFPLWSISFLGSFYIFVGFSLYSIPLAISCDMHCCQLYY